MKLQRERDTKTAHVGAAERIVVASEIWRGDVRSLGDWMEVCKGRKLAAVFDCPPGASHLTRELGHRSPDVAGNNKWSDPVETGTDICEISLLRTRETSKDSTATSDNNLDLWNVGTSVENDALRYDVKAR